ncbi:MAG: NUDIX hydrolase [Chloroflexota bacterium]|nr:NUDIX hydrolase [Chloroflexota bacterium]
MITFERNGKRFNHRAVGVLLHEERVLLHRAEWDDFWALPGGRVELLEPSAETLKREMHEELSVDIRVERLLWVLENFFEYQGEQFHELGLYYLISLPPDCPLLQREGPFPGDEQGVPLIFHWFPLDLLPDIILYPTFLRHALSSLPDHPLHLVHTDDK